MQLDIKIIALIILSIVALSFLSLSFYYRSEMIEAKHDYAISQSQLSQERVNNQNLRNEITNQNEKIEKMGEDAKTYMASINELNENNKKLLSNLNTEAKTQLDVPKTNNAEELLQWMKKEALLNH